MVGKGSIRDVLLPIGRSWKIGTALRQSHSRELCLKGARLFSTTGRERVAANAKKIEKSLDPLHHVADFLSRSVP